MSEMVEGLIAELDAFEPTDDSVDNEERLQIFVDRWEEMPEDYDAIPAMLRVFEQSRSDQPGRARAVGSCDRRGAGLRTIAGGIPRANAVLLCRLDDQPDPQQRIAAGCAQRIWISCGKPPTTKMRLGGACLCDGEGISGVSGGIACAVSVLERRPRAKATRRRGSGRGSILGRIRRPGFFSRSRKSSVTSSTTPADHSPRILCPSTFARYNLSANGPICREQLHESILTSRANDAIPISRHESLSRAGGYADGQGQAASGTFLFALMSLSRRFR